MKFIAPVENYGCEGRIQLGTFKLNNSLGTETLKPLVGRQVMADLSYRSDLEMGYITFTPSYKERKGSFKRMKGYHEVDQTPITIRVNIPREAINSLEQGIADYIAQPGKGLDLLFDTKVDRRYKLPLITRSIRQHEGETSYFFQKVQLGEDVPRGLRLFKGEEVSAMVVPEESQGAKKIRLLLLPPNAGFIYKKTLKPEEVERLSSLKPGKTLEVRI